MNPFSGKHVSGSAKRSERVEGSSSPRSKRGLPGPSHPRGCPRGLGGLSRPVRARGPRSAALTEGRRARWPPQQSCGVRDTSAGVARMWGACSCTDVLDRLERERSDSRLRHGIPSREQASGGGGQGRRAGDGLGFGSGPRSKWRLHHLPAGRRSSSSSSPEPQFPHLRNVGPWPCRFSPRYSSPPSPFPRRAYRTRVGGAGCPPHPRAAALAPSGRDRDLTDA